jgi:hypothetical protein
MKEFDPNIVEYMQEQLPDIADSYEDAVLAGDPEYAQYLAGITEAYEHIINKFGSLYEAS